MRQSELTETEHQIALRAINGKSNEQIARELYVTIKAVEWHLTNIYRKTGTRRAGLAEALAIPTSVDVVTEADIKPPRKESAPKPRTETALYLRVNELERRLTQMERLFEGLRMSLLDGN